MTFRFADLAFLLRFCCENGSLLGGFRVQECRFLAAFCLKDHCLFLTFCGKNRGTLFTLCLHLLFHGFTDRCRRLNVLQLNTGNLDAPGIRCGIDRCQHAGIDCLTGGQGCVKFHVTDDVTQCCGGEIFHCHDRIFNAVCIQFRIKDQEVHNGVNHHRDVIFCNNRLRCKVRHLFLQQNLACYTVHYRQHEMNARLPCRIIPSEPFNDEGTSLRNDSQACDQHKNHQYENYKNIEENWHDKYLLFVTFQLYHGRVFKDSAAPVPPGSYTPLPASAGSAVPETESNSAQGSQAVFRH